MAGFGNLPPPPSAHEDIATPITNDGVENPELSVPEGVDLPLLDIVEHLLGIVGGVLLQGLHQQLHQQLLLLLTQGALPLCLWVKK